MTIEKANGSESLGFLKHRSAFFCISFITLTGRGLANHTADSDFSVCMCSLFAKATCTDFFFIFQLIFEQCFFFIIYARVTDYLLFIFSAMYTKRCHHRFKSNRISISFS